MLYDYFCNSCKTKIEVKHGIHETPNIVCDNCGKNFMEKIITTPPMVQYIGDWYKTKKKY
jgi:putative FmdB family regulatory protein